MLHVVLKTLFGNITFLHLRLKLKPGEWYRPPGPLVKRVDGK